MPWPVLAAQCVTPNAKTQSEAEFLAAIHNAHYHQPYPVVYYHCVQALRLCPENAQLIMQYLELQTRRIPMMMSTSAEQIGKFGSAAIQHYLFASSFQQLDPVLLSAMADALAIMGINARKKLNEIWREEYGGSHGKQDLLHYYFCFGTHQTQETKFTLPGQFQVDKWPLSHYYKAYWLESRFIFVAQKDRPVQLCFTGRLPGSSLLEGDISLSVNHQLLGEMAISQEWSTWDVLIAGDFLKNGVNEIIIRWPAPPPQDAHVFQELQTPLDVFSVFGEVHSITVSVAQKIAPAVPDAAGLHEKAIPV